VAVLSLVAAWSVLFTTPWGTGTGWDQAMYIGAARDLLAGKGLTVAWSMDAGRPLTHYPPLFPAMLALLGMSGADPWDVARYVNAVLRGVDLLVVSLLATWASGGSRWAGVIAAFTLLTSVHMEFVHGSAFSDPLFLVLMLASLALAARYVARGGPLTLVVAAVLVACAVLTRYAGLSLVPAIALALLWWRRPGLGLFATVACVPLGLWVLHNALTGDLLVGDRSISWHQLTAQQLGQALFTTTDWVLPTRIGSSLVSPEGNVRPLGAGVFLAIAAGLGWWTWQLRRSLTTRTYDSEADVFRRLSVLFVVAYIAGALISMVLFDDLVQLDTRILAPVFLCLVLLASAEAPRALLRAWSVTRLRAPVVLGVALLVTTWGVRFGVLASTGHTQGVMYSNADWLGSSTMQLVRNLPRDATVFSNAPDAVYMLAGRSTYEIPNVGHAEAFSTVLRQAVRVAKGPVVLVYFGDPNIAYRQPVPMDEIQRWLPTRSLGTPGDGDIYAVEPATGGSRP
jgi:hypothetical protein